MEDDLWMQHDFLMEQATAVVSQALNQANIQHVIIGGQAGALLGSRRQTEDVDVLVNCPGMAARAAVAARDARFVMINNHMTFRATKSIAIPIEFLQGGDGATLKMPEVSTVPILEIDSIPVLHPSRLVCLKLRRWMHIADSTRPQSITKARNDGRDIMFLVNWLVQHNSQMDFQDLDAQRKASLLEGIRLFRTKNPSVEKSLSSIMPQS